MPVSNILLGNEVWNITLDMMKRKILQWGASWFKMVGHLVLIKYVLSALPLYHFSLLQAPVSIHNKMEIILRDFLWQGGKQEKRKFNLVKGRHVTDKYENGGLSICILQLLNFTFGGKNCFEDYNRAIAMVETSSGAEIPFCPKTVLTGPIHSQQAMFSHLVSVRNL